MASRKYKEMADQFFKEKCEKEFPDFTVDDSNVSTGKVTLSNEGMSIALLYKVESGTYQIESITIKPTQSILVTNYHLTGVCLAIKEVELDG
jgi:hypothetical protein